MLNTQTIKLLRKNDIKSNNNSDIATLLTLEEILAMNDIREQEKQSCINCCKNRHVKGFIYYAYTSIPMFIDMGDGDYEVV